MYIFTLIISTLIHSEGIKFLLNYNKNHQRFLQSLNISSQNLATHEYAIFFTVGTPSQQLNFAFDLNYNVYLFRVFLLYQVPVRYVRAQKNLYHLHLHLI